MWAVPDNVRWPPENSGHVGESEGKVHSLALWAGATSTAVQRGHTYPLHGRERTLYYWASIWDLAHFII